MKQRPGAAVPLSGWDRVRVEDCQEANGGALPVSGSFDCRTGNLGRKLLGGRGASVEPLLPRRARAEHFPASQTLCAGLVQPGWSRRCGDDKLISLIRSALWREARDLLSQTSLKTKRM